MWNGGHPSSHSDETSRRLSIQMAIAQHTGSPAPAYAAYDYGQPDYQRHAGPSQRQYAGLRNSDDEDGGDMSSEISEEEDDDNGYNKKLKHVAARGQGAQPPPVHHYDDQEEDDDDDDDDEDDDDGNNNEHQVQHSEPMKPRGKPEAMAARLASAALRKGRLDEMDVDVDADADREAEVVAQPLDDSMEVDADGQEQAAAVVSEPPAASQQPKKKRKKASTGTANANSSTPTPKKTKPASSSTGGAASSSSSSSSSPGPHLTMQDPIKPITTAEYQNLKALMRVFCKVPLLAEFSRPVSLLHPELMNVYTKIVDHPIDLGRVCRKIRRRDYKCLRDVRLDIWRIFANCVKYHSHPTNKEAVPSFISIAHHLRMFFNELWQEYMLPSDPPPTTGKASKGAAASISRKEFAKRKEDRERRMIISSLNMLYPRTLRNAADSLELLIRDGGCVDKLDTKPVWGHGADADDTDNDLEVVVKNLKGLQEKLRQSALDLREIGLDEVNGDLRRCYTEDVFESNTALRMRVANRLDRWIGKVVVAIHEASCRGVSQSSIWGCMAAVVWARESSKKPFWPALVLGIMAPPDQREEWHTALTLRNEVRLPEKLRAQLGSGKRKAEASIKKQSLGQLEPQSFFLVEFLGTHEFIWVRESDIIEHFEPEDDPNQNLVQPPGSKKKRSSRSNVSNVISSKMYASAVDEGKWAIEEFEVQMHDIAVDDKEEEEDHAEDVNYSYSILSQSDDEADEEYNDDQGTASLDVDECNELLATNGLLDLTTNGRKNAKKRLQAIKRQKAEADKKQKADRAKKLKAEQCRKKRDAKAREREDKKEQKDLEKKRKKRARERERALKGTEQMIKKRKVSESDDLKKSASGRRNLIAGKRERATAIVEGYLDRAIRKGHYRPLSLGGVMAIPASTIDSSGLLGMALAFRAAAGEIAMPEESGVQDTNKKPWEVLNPQTKRTSKGRVEVLQRQIDLLEAEIAKRKASIERRKGLARQLKRYSVHDGEQIQMDDDAARQNPLAKRKKPPPAAVASSSVAALPSSSSSSLDNRRKRAKSDASISPITSTTTTHRGNGGSSSSSIGRSNMNNLPANLMARYEEMRAIRTNGDAAVAATTTTTTTSSSPRNSEYSRDDEVANSRGGDDNDVDGDDDDDDDDDQSQTSDGLLV